MQNKNGKLKRLLDITKIVNERNVSVIRDKSMTLEAHNRKH